MADWIDARDLVVAAGITQQRASTLARTCKWHGAAVTVRKVPKGAREVWQFHVPSLPFGIREALKIAPAPPPQPGKGGMAIALERQHYLAPLLNAKKRSKEYAAAFEAAVAYFGSKSSIHRWLAPYKKHGLDALIPKPGKGTKPKLVSTELDPYFQQLPEAERAQAVQSLIQMARTLKANGNGAIEWHLTLRAYDILRVAGINVPNGLQVTRHFIVKNAINVNALRQFRKDHKPFFDNHLMRIQRSTADLRPMDIVFGDVLHLDFLLQEFEGYQRAAKAICWLDFATMRLWIDVVILPKGQAVRSEHVIASFIRMASHNAWGVPGTLYIDNGSEYQWPDMIDDLYKLRSFHTMRVEFNAAKHARPYNAPAKAIEGVFAVIRKIIMMSLPGYIGGNRMNSIVANVGKAPLAFSGSHQAFVNMILNAVAFYNSKPQGKRAKLAGMSPDGKFTSFADFQAVTLDPEALATAFTTEESREVRQGRISVNGRYYFCDALTKLPGQSVSVLLPRYERDWNRLPIKFAGEIVGYAEPDIAFHPLDPQGAKEQSRRAGLQRKAMKALGTLVPAIDPLATLLESNALAAKHLPAPVVNMPGAHITASDEQREIARNVKMTPKQRARLESDAEEANRRRLREFNQKLERKAVNE